MMANVKTSILNVVAMILAEVNTNIVLAALDFEMCSKKDSYPKNKFEMEIIVGDDSWASEFNLCSAVSFLGSIPQVAKMTFEEEHNKVVALLLHTNESSFFSSLNLISETFHSNSKRWNPYWFLSYPKSISTDALEVIRKTVLQFHKNSIHNNMSGPLIDSDFYITFPMIDGITRNLSIWELYNIKNRTVLEEISFDHSPNKDILINILRKVERRTNFQGINIIGAAGYDKDYPFETEFSDHSNASFKGGLAVNLYRDLRDTLNFRELAIPGTWIQSNGVDSIDHLVLKGLSDIAISQSTLTLDTRPDINSLLTYVQPTSSARMYAIFVQPPASSIRNIFVLPFSTNLWISLLVALFLIILTTLGTARIKRYSDSKADTIYNQTTIWAMGTFCQQGYWDKIPESASMKILFITTTTLGFVSYVAFAAEIVSALTVKVIPIGSIAELKNSSLKIYGDTSNIFSAYMFEGWVNASQSQSLIFPEEAPSVLANSSSAFLGFTDAFIGAARRINFTTESSMCKKFSYLPFSHVSYKSSMFIKKGSPFREFFNNKVICIKEKGLNKRYMDRYNQLATPQCPSGSTTEKRALGLRDVFTAFGITLAAYFSCPVLLILEKIIFTYKL